MDMVRRELGEDAIIVSTETTEHGTRIVAALEEPEVELRNPRAAAEAGDGIDPIDAVHEALLAHGLPNRLLERLVDASFLAGADDPVEALAGALAGLFGFEPVTHGQAVRPIMLVGPPGAGKTVTVAKLATRAIFARRRVRLITTDTVRAGAFAQLDAFAKVLAVPLASAETERQLVAQLNAAAGDEVVLIDTAGVNPYSPRDMAELDGLARAVPAEPILVTPAGGDVVDAMQQAQEFARLGVTRMLATRLDTAFRLGSVLAAADAANLAFAEVSMTPSVPDGLAPIDALALAKLLMPNPARDAAAQPVTRGLRS